MIKQSFSLIFLGYTVFALLFSALKPEMVNKFLVDAMFFAVLAVVLFRKKMSINVGSGIMLSFVVAFAANFLLNGNCYGSNMVYCLPMIWLLFFVFRRQVENEKEIALLFTCFYVLMAVVQVVFGVLQTLGLIENFNKELAFSGTFGSLAAYAGFLAATSPLVLSCLFFLKKQKKFEIFYYLLLAFFVLQFYMLIITQQRGAWIAWAVGCGAVLLAKYWNRIAFLFSSAKRKTATITGLVVLVAAASVFLYKYKEDSAFGRLLVWKVAVQAPHQNLLLGNGIGYFEAQYGKWQAEYFEQNGGTEKELHVADYVTTAYNEFLETALEQGVVVAVLLAALFFLALTGRWRWLSTAHLGAKASVAAVAVLMLCSFPLKVPSIALYLVFCMAIVFRRRRKQIEITNCYVRVALSLCLVAATIGLSCLGFSYKEGMDYMQRGQQQVIEHNNPKVAIELYGLAEESQPNNGLLHFYKGSAYFLAGQHQQAIDELSTACRLSSNPNAFILLGNAYKEKKDVRLAERAYLTAAYMQPNRLYPKYLLAKLHNEIGDPNLASSWAQKVVQATEKVPTTAAKEMKEEMRLLLQAASNQQPEVDNDL